MFELREGFHIVIGNPPYILLQTLALDRESVDWLMTHYSSAQYKVDTYHLFIERGIDLLSSQGILSYITPNTFLKNKHTNKLRELLVRKTKVRSILLFYTKIFEEQAVDNVVFLSSKAASLDLLDIGSESMTLGRATFLRNYSNSVSFHKSIFGRPITALNLMLPKQLLR